MGAGRPTQWHAQDTTIRALYRLPARERRDTGLSPAMGPAATEMADAAARLLSHSSFHGLFAEVPPGTYVSGVVVACYLGVSRLAIERKLADTFGVRGRLWRNTLTRHSGTGAIGPALLDGRYRWSFVTQELEPLMVLEVARANLQRQSPLGYIRPVVRPVARMMKLSKLRPAELVEGLQFVVDVRGRVVGALGQGHITAAHLIDVLNAGGRLRAMDPLEALGYAWTVPLARMAWDVALREVLVVQSEAVFALLQRGEAATSALALDRAMPRSPRLPPGRLPGGGG